MTNVYILVKGYKMIIKEELKIIIQKHNKYNSFHFNKLIFIWLHKI